MGQKTKDQNEGKQGREGHILGKNRQWQKAMSFSKVDHICPLMMNAILKW